jgi:hypothetical protein
MTRLVIRRHGIGSTCEGFCSHHDEDGDDTALGRAQGSAPLAELGHRVRASEARQIDMHSDRRVDQNNQS